MYMYIHVHVAILDTAWCVGGPSPPSSLIHVYMYIHMHNLEEAEAWGALEHPSVPRRGVQRVQQPRD